MSIKRGNEHPCGFPGGFSPLESEPGVAPKGDSPEALPARIERYAAAHARAIKMAEYLLQVAATKPAMFRGFIVKLSKRIKKCGDYLVFRHYPRLQKVRLHAAEFCQVHHLCPFCAIRRGAKLLRLYLARFELLSELHPQATGYFVTLTVKDGEDLQERFQHLQRNARKLMARRDVKRHQQGAAGSVMSHTLGGVGAYEFKRGKGSGLWHPHFHAVFLSGTEISQEKLSAEWRDLTGDSYIVDVRALYGESAILGFLECFKYAVKFSDLPLADNYEAYRSLARCRLVTSFGVFRGINVEHLADDPVPEDEPFIELFYRYRGAAGYSYEPGAFKRSLTEFRREVRAMCQVEAPRAP